YLLILFFFFFFQAEDGIRDGHVTGVQTCALPISIVGPRTDDICYATTNRQAAVKRIADMCDLLLVIGSANSSNSMRLVEVSRDCGTEAHLIDNAGEVREEWLEGKRVVGISSGASAPENLVQELIVFFRARGV